MRVMQVMAGAEFGGAEAFFTRLAIGLHRAGLDQKIVIRENAKRAATLRNAGLEPVEIPFGGRLDMRTPLALRREIKAYKPDIVLSWMNRATRAIPKSRGKFVHAARLGGYYDLKYYGNCNHLIGNTQDIVAYLEKEGWPAERAAFLPNFVSEERLPAVPRQDFFTPDKSPLILAMGRMHENKAFDILFQAVSRAPNVYLWLAGEGPMRAELETMAERLAVKPRVRFLGWRDDTAALFAACDLFVCPSRHEPLGNVVVEAWAQGVPVIATDSLGPGTLISHMESGILTPVDNAVELARAIRHVLDDQTLRDRIARGGRSAFESYFTENIVIDHYLRFFERIVS